MLQQLLSSSAQPFRATPDARFYFDHSGIENARQTVLRAIVRAEGPVVVLGGSGFGKSLLADLVAEQLRERLDVVMLQSARLCSRRALLQNILFELKLPYRDMAEGELRLSILDRLEPSTETAPEGVLIVVDEAHTLHWKLIDELRLISNFTRNHQPRVKLLLLGNMRLEDTLTTPQLESFNQRLAARCYLQPMNRSETVAYVQHQVKLCGLDPNAVVTQDALQAVYSASEGIPRLVNQLMNHSIWLACNSAQSPISASLVSEAWRDLQQLPTPWSTGKTDADSTPSSIEFGELSDDHEEVAEDSRELLQESDAWNPVVNFEQQPLSPDFQFAIVASDTTTDWTSDDSIHAMNQTESEVELAVERFEKAEDTSRNANVAEYQLDEPEANFFAAFHSDPSSQFLNALDEGAEDDSWRIKVGPSPKEAPSVQSVTSDPATLPLNLLGSPDFNWFNSIKAEVPVVVPQSARPTDDDRLVGLIAEQQQYDSMGVWENDPPLKTLELSQQDEMPMTSNAAYKAPMPMTNSVFGNDFEEEVIVGQSPTRLVASVTQFVNSKQSDFAPGDVLQQATKSSGSFPTAFDPESSTQTGSAPSEAKTTTPPASTDYLVRMQQFADALSHVARVEAPAMDSDRPMASSTPNAQMSDSLNASLWSIDVGTVASTARPVEDAIEDIVSQLNFSAFSVEPFSVEQIPLEPLGRAVPEDSIRRGSNDQVYMMHRPTQAQNDLTVQDFDDDRDLLIVEEDIPVSSRMLDNSISEHPAQKTASYSQLFAKLRK